MAALQDTTRGEAWFQRGASGLAVGALTKGHQTHPCTGSSPCARGRDRGEARGILSRACPPPDRNLIAGENPKDLQRGAAKMAPYWASA